MRGPPATRNRTRRCLSTPRMTITSSARNRQSDRSDGHKKRGKTRPGGYAAKAETRAAPIRTISTAVVASASRMVLTFSPSMRWLSA